MHLSATDYYVSGFWARLTGFASDPHWALPLDPTVPTPHWGLLSYRPPVPTILFDSGDDAGALHQTPLEELRVLPQTLTLTVQVQHILLGVMPPIKNTGARVSYRPLNVFAFL